MKFKTHTLTKDNHIIKLYEVIHVGPASLYADISARIQDDYNSKFVIHHEGVKMPENKFKNFRRLYPMLAKASGRELQPKPCVPYEIKDVEYKNLALGGKMVLHYIEGISKLLFFIHDLDPEAGDRRIKEVIKESEAKSPTKSMADNSKLLKLLGGKREVVASKAAMSESKNVSMIWGRAHAPNFIRIFTKAGYKVSKVEDLDS